MWCACVYVCVLTSEFKLFLYVSQVGVQIFDGDADYGGSSFDQVRNLKVREPLIQQVLHPLLNAEIQHSVVKVFHVLPHDVTIGAL